MLETWPAPMGLLALVAVTVTVAGEHVASVAPTFDLDDYLTSKFDLRFPGPSANDPKVTTDNFIEMASVHGQRFRCFLPEQRVAAEQADVNLTAAIGTLNGRCFQKVRVYNWLVYGTS